jgi:thioredoxin-related protein
MKFKLFLPVVFTIVGFTLKAEVNFLMQPEWAKVLQSSKAENKFILVDAYTDWCSWCKTMDKTTFGDKTTADYINSHFVAVKMEMETGFGATLAMKYRVNGYPTFLVFAPNGQFIERVIGYQGPEEFQKSLAKIIATPVTQYPTGVSAKVDLNYPGFYKAAFIKNKGEKRVNPDSATVVSYLHKKDVPQELAWSVLVRFGNMTDEFDEVVLRDAVRFSSMYGENEVQSLIGNIIYKRFRKVVALKDEQAMLNEIFPLADKYLGGNAATTKLEYKLDFYKAQKNYTKVLEALDDLSLKLGSASGSMVNSICWGIYLESDDAALLNQCAARMKEVISKEPDYANLDTYAALLYKTANYTQAKIYAEKAIAEGKKADQKVSETEQLLAKINAAVSLKK